MRRYAVFLMFALLFVGCANKIEVKCPSCTIESQDGATSYKCSECTIEASGKEDFNYISIPKPERP